MEVEGGHCVEWYEPGIDGGWAHVREGTPAFEPWAPLTVGPEATAADVLHDFVAVHIIGRGGVGGVEERLEQAGFYRDLGQCPAGGADGFYVDEHGEPRWRERGGEAYLGADGQPMYVRWTRAAQRRARREGGARE